MISDILFDASEEIKEYLKKYPQIYEDIKEDIMIVLKKMDNIRKVLDTPTSYD